MELLTASLFRLDVEPVSFPELPCRPERDHERRNHHNVNLYIKHTRQMYFIYIKITSSIWVIMLTL